MAKMPDEFVDLTVTSPPYDNLRTYGNSLDCSDKWGDHLWKLIIKELYRVTKQGGLVVWVAGDGVIKGSETGTSFRQALWALECGFNLHDTMIYQKNSYPFPMSTRYYQVFEYMFVLSRGKPLTVNLLKQEGVWKQKNKQSATTRNTDGTTARLKYETGKDFRTKDNIWKFNTGYMRSSKDKDSFKHPAIFPEQLAHDHIISWSNEYDLVYDPFMGSGTTAKMAILTNRNYVGSEINEKYVQIAQTRIDSVGVLL